MKITEKEIAECAGLWLAEGDKKTNKEVTFTNSSIELILFFQKVIESLYQGKNKSRLYIYSPSPRIMITSLNNLRIRNYVDIRAKRTYYIYRLADVKFSKYWKEAVENITSDKNFYPELLRGIFAGEGNVKHDLKNNNSRNVRIASGVRDKFMERMLVFFEIPIKFDQEKRAYWVTGRYVEKLNKMNIASLHPEKESKFRKMIDSVNEMHYSPGELKLILLGKLGSFKRTKDLANEVNRSQIHVLEVLRDLKHENKVGCIKFKGKTVWVKKDLLEKFLEEEKYKILHNLKKYASVTELSRGIGIYRKSISRKLREYQKEGLVERVNRNRWKMTEKGKIIVGVDESGSESQ